VEENRIFQREFVHMNRPFIASVKLQLIKTLPAFLNYCIQLWTALKKTCHKKVETNFFVGSVEEISMSCIPEKCNVQCNSVIITVLF
jgi:hypothetical protein